MKLARLPDGGPEIFHTLQGEGRHAGRPSVFIRASLCNLYCQWCDTPYTWNWSGTPYRHESPRKYRREEEIDSLSAAEVHERLRAFPCRHYVLTGGEPLLQEGAWLELMDLAGDGSFEAETNGTLLPSPAFLERIEQLNVSPKLANSGVPEEKRLKPGVLAALAATGKADFKFVVGEARDLEEIRRIAEGADLAPDRVFLMAQARDAAELDARGPAVAALAKEQGYRYSDRLHLRLYGAARGT